jgi:hypothetical protein
MKAIAASASKPEFIQPPFHAERAGFMTLSVGRI